MPGHLSKLTFGHLLTARSERRVQGAGRGGGLGVTTFNTSKVGAFQMWLPWLVQLSPHDLLQGGRPCPHPRDVTTNPIKSCIDRWRGGGILNIF